jgi:hypothetical protein
VLHKEAKLLYGQLMEMMKTMCGWLFLFPLGYAQKLLVERSQGETEGAYDTAEYLTPLGSLMEVGISYLGWCDPAGVTIQSSSILGKWQYLFRISIHKPALRVPHLLSELIHLLSELIYPPLGFARGAAVHIMCCLSNGAWPQRGQISITMPTKNPTLATKKPMTTVSNHR